jgi:hypothetical protein
MAMETSLDELKRISASELDREDDVATDVLEVVSQAQNGVSVVGQPQIKLVRQEHVSTEYFSRNGIHKQVHVVVKNLNFPIELSSNVDLTKCEALEAKLIYDFDRAEDQKLPVTYVKTPPLGIHSHLLSSKLT